ncbi:MAG TPA: type I polyketide synthase [Anaerolineae bacterium]|nr:type I polyketide synthase [Anaerolineae bacterium]
MSVSSESSDRKALLKNAMAAIDDLQAKLDAANRARTEPIAIVGLACRFPGGAHDPAAYWQLLHEGRDAVREYPAERRQLIGVDAETMETDAAWYGGFLDDIEQFDPKFFGIAPREAATMDPQQRLALEVSWEALESAGIAPDSLGGSPTGVFLGITTNDYSQLAKAGGPDQLDVYVATGSALNAAPGRVAYTLGLQGPCMAIDTACSSSLVALHQACQSLRNRESDLALAGGVNTILMPEAFICFNKWGMMAPDGRCKTFDARADGFVRGEGCGVIVLKRLSDAQAAHDNILAVIRGSAVNQDGHSSGLTVPNGPAQEAVIRKALAFAGIEPGAVDYVEAHGTGTSLGDPIEVEAIGAALGTGRTRPLMLGSVKTNIGHLESASGIAGLIKVVLAMQHEELPPHLHLRERSPRIPWPDFPIVIPTEPVAWTRGERARIAGVSAFGFSGTNAHVVLEEAPETNPHPQPLSLTGRGAGMRVSERPLHILSLSAKSEQALKELAARHASQLSNTPTHTLASYCFTANTGRAHFAQRAALVAASPEELRERLANLTAGEASKKRPKIAFLFTGQGAQYVGMGRQLYEAEPTFRATLDKCDALLRPYLNQSLIAILYPEQSTINSHQSSIDETAFTQPALFALEYALAELWQSWGIAPSAVMGHSVGEYVAACVAGVFSLEDGLKLIVERARLMQALPRDGEMAAVFADEATVAQAIAPYTQDVAIAAINGPEAVVISGRCESVRLALQTLEAQGFRSRALNVSHAFHSPLMEPMLDAFEQTAASVAYSAPRSDLISNVTGRLASDGEATSAAYWRRHIRQAVRFADSIQALHELGYDTFVEIGPSPTLLSMAQRCSPDATAAWLPSLRKGQDDWRIMLDSLGALYVRGADVNWAGLDRDYRRQKVVLPTYPFQRQRYWLESGRKPLDSRRSQVENRPGGHPLLGQRLRSPRLKDIVFESNLGIDWPTFLNDHRVYGVPLFPATGYLELGMAAAQQVLGHGSHVLEEVEIQEALVLPADGARVVQVTISPVENGIAVFQVFSLEDEPEPVWRLHTTGKIHANSGADTSASVSLADIRERCAQAILADDYYRRLADAGLDYGASFRNIRQLWRGEGAAVGQIALSATLAPEASLYQIHPALLDACFQLLGAALPDTYATDTTVYVPVGLEEFRVYRPGQAQVWGQARVDADVEGAEVLTGEVRLFDETGLVVAEISGLRLKRASRGAIRQAAHARVDDWIYAIEWRPQMLPSESAARAPGNWLILADQGGIGDGLAAQLRAQGETCILVRPGDQYRVLEADCWQIDPARPADFTQLLADTIEHSERPYRGAIHLWGLDAPREITADALAAIKVSLYGGTLYLTQALARYAEANPALLNGARLWVTTRGAQSVESDAAPVSVAQAPLWGLGRTIALEHPELRCTCVDLDPSGDATQAVLAELSGTDKENQVAFRDGKRYVARLARMPKWSHNSAQSGQQAFELKAPADGILDNLSREPATRQRPGPHDIEVRVRASGLNFRDVLNALGLYPGPAIALGNECAGVVETIGEGATGFKAGDEVIALAPGTFKTFAIAASNLVFAKPANLSFEEAVTIPTTFLTAYYGLHHLADIKAGDRVLIHAAAGGVGLAAVQLALRAGAEVFGTAGSPEKRAYLESIGVPHVLNSRTLDFANEIKALTNGAGVHIVLNSLADDFIPKSLSVLADGGCFLEIGKRGIWTTQQVAEFNSTLTYHAYDLAEVSQRQPELIQSMLSQLLADFASGALKPLPLRAFSIEHARDAFRFMAQAKQIGKIVITQPTNQLSIRPAATYLITGGLGGLGLTVARWLVERGARNLVLMGRTRPSDAAQKTLDELERLGAKVSMVLGDVANRDDVARAVSGLAAPLRGIIHAAGTLDDGPMSQMTWPRFQAVLAPKVDGAWHLHTLTQVIPLDFFVMFSAGAALLGSPGQSNYAAANAFLDGLAHYRHALGLPALSINWGAWAEVGMAAKVGSQVQRLWAAQGIGLIEPALGMRVLEQLLTQTFVQVGVVPFDWERFAQQTQNIDRPVLRELLHAPQTTAHTARTGLTREALLAAPDRPAALQTYLAALVMRTMRVSELDPAQSLSELGLDSLMAVEMKNRIEADLGLVVPMVKFLQGPTIVQLTAQVLERLTDGAPDSAALPVAPAMGDEQSETKQLLANLEALSDAEVDSLLKDLIVPAENAHE